MSDPIIRSLLDTDLYKLTMQQVVLHQFPGVQAEYQFRCRNTPAFPMAELLPAVNRQLDALCELRFTPDEIAYLRSLRYLKPDYVDYLELFHLNRRFISVTPRADGRLDIHARGPMVQAMMFEIYVLAIVNELYFDELIRRQGIAGGHEATLEEGRRRIGAKVDKIRAFQTSLPANAPPLLLADFGTRRRFARDWLQDVVTVLHAGVPDVFRGTSNMDLARRLGLTPIGTMAHEFLQAFQALDVNLRQFQKAALESWVQEYRGDLGIALTDVVGMDAFLADFDLYFAKLFDGLRHDSGDPVVWGEKMIEHYHKLRIDPATKMLTFSDSLDIDRAIALYGHFATRTQVSFGIGTNLTNDLGIEPLQIVMKLVRCNDRPVAKLSDTANKLMCDDPVFLAYLRQIFNLERI